MRKSAVYATVVILAAVLFGCAGAPVHWRANPETLSARADGTDITLEAIKQGNAFYSAFRLTITNGSNTAVTVDWNTSEYRYNEKPGGIFWFEGITAEAIKDKTIPVDKVPPGGSISRVIAPLQLIAITPIKQSKRQTPSFSAGRLPAGKNDVFLRLFRDATPQTVTLSIVISVDGTTK